MSKRLAIVLGLAAQSLPAEAFRNPLTYLDDFQKPELRYQQLQIKPYYGLTLLYDDNIYRVGRDKENGSRTGCLPASAASCSGGYLGSFVATNDFGVKLRLPIAARQLVSLEYGVTAINYQRQPTANDAIYQKLGADYAFRAAAFTFKAFDRYLNTEDPAYNPNNVVSGALVARERRYENAGGASLEYPLAQRLYATADASATVHKYVSPSLGALLNRSETSLGLRAAYHRTPESRFYAALRRKLVHYSARRAANHKDWDAAAGVEGDLAPKLKGSVEGGYHYQAYDADDFANNQNYVVRALNVAVALHFRPTKRDRVSLTLHRGVNEAVTGGRWYLSAGAGLAAERTLGKFVLGANGAYQVDKYGEANTVPAPGQSPFGGYTAVRRDDIYSIGFHADYKLQDWLVTSLSFQRRMRYSIFSEQFNYDNNQTSWSVKAQF